MSLEDTKSAAVTESLGEAISVPLTVTEDRPRRNKIIATRMKGESGKLTLDVRAEPGNVISRVVLVLSGKRTASGRRNFERVGVMTEPRRGRPRNSSRRSEE